LKYKDFGIVCFATETTYHCIKFSEFYKVGNRSPGDSVGDSRRWQSRNRQIAIRPARGTRPSPGQCPGLWNVKQK